jgi:hypothetical protein
VHAPAAIEKDRIASIDDNKIAQRIGNSGTVEIVAGCSETLWQSQQTALAARLSKLAAIWVATRLKTSVHAHHPFKWRTRMLSN